MLASLLSRLLTALLQVVPVRVPRLIKGSLARLPFFVKARALNWIYIGIESNFNSLFSSIPISTFSARILDKYTDTFSPNRLSSLSLRFRWDHL
jgi:hypothetical protein